MEHTNQDNIVKHVILSGTILLFIVYIGMQKATFYDRVAQEHDRVAQEHDRVAQEYISSGTIIMCFDGEECEQSYQ